MSKPGRAGPLHHEDSRVGAAVAFSGVKLAVLSSPRSYSTQRRRGCVRARPRARVLDTLRFAIDLSGDVPDLSTADVSSTISTPSSPASVHRSRSLDSPSFASSSRWTCTRRLPPMALRTRGQAPVDSDPLPTRHRHPGHDVRTRPADVLPRSTASAVLPS